MYGETPLNEFAGLSISPSSAKLDGERFLVWILRHIYLMPSDKLFTDEVHKAYEACPAANGSRL